MKRYLPLLLLVCSADCCCNVKLPRDVKCGISYGLIQSDARSSKSVMTRKRVGSLGKCKDFAETKRALAFNFGDFSLYICIYQHDNARCS